MTFAAFGRRLTRVLPGVPECSRLMVATNIDGALGLAAKHDPMSAVTVGSGSTPSAPDSGKSLHPRVQ
jgi:hypothetical protein